MAPWSTKAGSGLVLLQWTPRVIRGLRGGAGSTSSRRATDGWLISNHHMSRNPAFPSRHCWVDYQDSGNLDDSRPKYPCGTDCPSASKFVCLIEFRMHRTAPHALDFSVFLFNQATFSHAIRHSPFPHPHKCEIVNFPMFDDKRDVRSVRRYERGGVVRNHRHPQY